MDHQTFHRVASDVALRTIFQAALLTANKGGYTVRELAEQLGIPKSTLHRWITTARDRSKRVPRVEVTDPPVGSNQCNHRRLFSDRRHRVCLKCLVTNFEKSPELMRPANFDPQPEDAPLPTRKFKPKLKKKAK